MRENQTPTLARLCKARLPRCFLPTRRPPRQQRALTEVAGRCRGSVCVRGRIWVGPRGQRSPAAAAPGEGPALPSRRRRLGQSPRGWDSALGTGQRPGDPTELSGRDFGGQASAGSGAMSPAGRCGAGGEGGGFPHGAVSRCGVREWRPCP